MVEAEDLVIDRSLDQVEGAETDQKAATHKPGRPEPMASPPTAPQHDQAQHDEDVCGHMEDAVEERIQSEIFEAVGGKACAAQHVMPLQHLMQNDAVEEAPEPQAEEDPGRSGKFSVFFCGVVQYLYSAQQPLTECILSKYLLIDQFDEMYFSFRLSCLNILHVSRSGQPR
jgi:hypothetical protein